MLDIGEGYGERIGREGKRGLLGDLSGDGHSRGWQSLLTSGNGSVQFLLLSTQSLHLLLSLISVVVGSLYELHSCRGRGRGGEIERKNSLGHANQLICRVYYGNMYGTSE